MTTTRIAALALAISALVPPALAEDPAPATPPASATPATDATPAPSAAAPAEPTPAQPAAPTAPAAPAANTGRVYVSYPVQSNATYDANLAIDDRWLVDPIKSGACVYFDLPVGDHKLHATTTPTWRVSVTAGSAAYTDLKFRSGSINGLVPVDGSAPSNLSACTPGTTP